MVDKVIGLIRQITELGLAIIALGVVLQIIFGAAVPFLGLDIVGSVVALVKQFGNENYSYTLHQCGSEEFEQDRNSLDFAFTSPPYFDTEQYSNEQTQSYL